jgi:hypothetical protein
MPILLCFIKLISCIYRSNISLISIVTNLFYYSSRLEGIRVRKEYLDQNCSSSLRFHNAHGTERKESRRRASR